MSLQRNILLTPGPATTTDSVKMAQVVPDICPREKDFSDVLVALQRDLVRLADGHPDHHACIPLGGSGTAAMEACINACVPAQGKVAIVVNGAYGQRLADMAARYGLERVILEFPVTQPADPVAVEAALEADPSISCLALVHHETTTGLLNLVRALGAVAARHNCLFVVDAISSFGGMPLSVVRDGIDLMISVANKCLQGLPGVSFVIARKSALLRLREYPQRAYYLNLVDQHDSLVATGQMRFTAPVQTLYALKQALQELHEEGGEARWERYRENCVVLREGLRALGFRLLLDESVSSMLMTSVLEPEHPAWNYQQVHDAMYQRGFTIYPGKVAHPATFRLATLGAIGVDDVRRFLAELRDCMSELGVDLREPGDGA